MITWLVCFSAWWKYSEETQWCTGGGRSELYSDTGNPINVTECQRLCQEKRPGCDAVEFWEKYNYACFECTDRSKISPYTWTNDLAYPVYVWIYSGIFLNLSRPGGGGLLEPAPTLKIRNFQTVKAMTTKFSDFS